MDSFTQPPVEPQGQPQYGQPQYGQPAPVPFKKKSQYGLISVVFGLLCVVITFVGLMKTINGSFFDIPVVQMALNAASGEDLVEEYDENLDKLEDELENAPDEDIEELEEAINMSADEFVDIMRAPSLNTVIKFAEVIGEAEGFETIGREDIEVLNIVRSVLVGYAVVVMLFALLAALLKNRALSIIGLMVSLAFFIFLAGVVFLILYAIACITHVVLVSKHKKAIRPY